MNIDERVYGYEPAASQLAELRADLRTAAKLNMELMEIRRENEAEIERLRREHEKAWADAQLKAAEIERLHGLLQEQLACQGPELARRAAEIERLRGTLRHVLVHPWDWDVLRVNAALGEGTWTSVRKGGY